MDQIIAQMTGTATIAIALFGIVFCLTQTEYSRVSRSFAMFLAAVAVNNIPDAFIGIIEPLKGTFVQPVEFTLMLSSALCLAPLFWIYVFTLTSTVQRRPERLYRHLLLPAAALLTSVGFSVLAPDVWVPFFVDEDMPTSLSSITFMLIMVLLQLAVYPQMAVYLIMIVRRLMRHRRRLRDVYASTEEHELRWIYVIGGLGALFWSAMSLVLFVAIDEADAGLPPALLIPAAFSGLALVATTTLWGLRQRPPLIPDPTVGPQRESDREPPSEQPGEKYEKSALSAEASARITRKLRAAMETDHLHRDPNLSLWTLARHIGASPNYISQTLNEGMGESFFDFVNRYRIAEAMTLLSTTDDTVLTITYDVGFNARSSFYNAFKRVTGQTPTSYRKKLSQRARMDDLGEAMREI